MEFLSDETLRIHFRFTPIHCSWLDQIEIWFGIINRQLLKRGNFEILEYLKMCIEDFIEQWNNGGMVTPLTGPITVFRKTRIRTRPKRRLTDME